MRRSEIIGLIGYFGTGKTTKAKELINFRVKSGSRALIITPDDSEWRDVEEVKIPSVELLTFEGIRKIVFDDDKIIEKLADNKTGFKNGILVFDDCRTFLEAKVDKTLRKIILRPRQRMLDIIYIVHGFDEAPVALLSKTSTFFLFETKDNIENRKPYLNRNYEILKKHYEEINIEAQTNNHYFRIIKNI